MKKETSDNIGHPGGKDVEVDAGVLVAVAQDISVQNQADLTPVAMELIEDAHSILWGIISSEKKKELCDER